VSMSTSDSDHLPICCRFDDRVVVGDWTIYQFLLYHFYVARVVCWNMRVGGGLDGRNVDGVSCASRDGPDEGGLMHDRLDG
jgi:hypothetical protein